MNKPQQRISLPPATGIGQGIAACSPQGQHAAIYHKGAVKNSMSVSELLLFLVKLLAGTGVFLVGVQLLTTNIEQLATGSIKDLFGKTANRRLINVGIGAVTTALIQSSGVTTVLIVGFVNVGVMNLYQATAMIMGANIGTTITAQIAALSAFPITDYIEILAFAGIMMAMVCKRDGVRKTGSILAGLGLVFIGLALMSDSMKANRDAIQSIFTVVRNPFLLFFIGIFLTALVQSSSATTSIVIAMSVAGLTIGTGGNEILYIILGTNIGSCVTALMSSIGAGTNARRASLIHLLFNTFGSVIFMTMLLIWPSFMQMTFARWFPSAATQIAMFHTFFNTICTLIFLPFTRGFVRLSELIIKEPNGAHDTVPTTYLDDRMLSSASLALVQLERETMRMSDIAMDAFLTSFGAFQKRDMNALPGVQEKIEEAGDVNQNILSYLIRLSAKSKLSEEAEVAGIHSMAGDVMRIAEIADNFTKYTRREVTNKLVFSDEVRGQLNEMVASIERLYGLTKRVVLDSDRTLLPALDAEEDKVDGYRKSLIDSHIDRLNRGVCQPESSGIFINLVSNLERLGDHLTYIAHAKDPQPAHEA